MTNLEKRKKEAYENNKRLFEIKKKIVLENGSKLFENWQENANITKEEFIEGLKWLSEDPLRTENLTSTRELGCNRKGLHKLRRVYSKTNDLLGIYEVETKRLWSRSNPCISFGSKL